MADVVVVTMADGCDDPQQIDQLVRLVERGVVVAAASRYSRGGQQVGGPFLKGFLSRLAGLSLAWLWPGWAPETPPIRSRPTTSDFVRDGRDHSSAGFEIGIEMVAKARRARLPVAELPTIWLERDQGVSNFKLVSWLPHYLRWWLFAFGAAPPGRARSVPPPTGGRRSWSLVTGRPDSSAATWSRSCWTAATGDRGRQLLQVRTGPTLLRRRIPDTGSSRRTPGMSDLLADRSLVDCDHFIAGAAMIGGISYFHTYAYDLLATNERIIAVVL